MSRFRPMVSRRAPSGTHFAELFLAPGPNRIGETGDNSYQAMYGYDWLLVWDRDDGLLHLWQERDGAWVEVLDDLPPVFGAPAPVGSRRWSLAFDQAARVILAYEDAEGVVRVTRWDPSLNQYVQNVTFAGVDPCVVIDAAWSHDVPNSDVLLFYLSSDRQRVLCRVQRDVYGTEHLIWDYGTPVILDRVIATPLRYQVLVSDATGTPLPEMLLSALYPYPAFDNAATFANALDGFYEVTVIRALTLEALSASAVAIAGEYAPAVTYVDTNVIELLQTAASALNGAYTSPIINVDLTAEAAQATAAPLQGEYVLAALRVENDSEAATTSAAALDGEYAL